MTGDLATVQSTMSGVQTTHYQGLALKGPTVIADLQFNDLAIVEQ